MATALPPDLRVLCRKLTSIPPAQLPQSLPSLISHVLRCREPLSAAQDQKVKDNGSDSAVLVNTLKKTVTSHLNGRSREARFAAIALIKTIVDVGGWEVLRTCEPWVRGLLSIVQKSDPIASKELAVVTLTRIYSLLHPYQSLVREIATPNIEAFVKACIQLVKSVAGQASTASHSLIETVCEAISTLVPLYHTTLRPVSSQLRTAVKQYLVPTDSDGTFVPFSLRRAARRLVISLHHVAAKSGGSEEWAKLVDGLLGEFHSTADQVLRAVDESWEPSNGQGRRKVELGGEPHGGGSGPDELPPWSGIDAGAQRLIGLLQYLGEALRYPTKAAVTVPTTALMDAVSRVSLIARLSKTQTWDQSLQTNAAIGRDERESLWSVMPDIHIAALQLVLALSYRLEENIIPVIPEILDHLARVFSSGISIPQVRITGYVATKQLLSLAGPTFSKPAVDMLEPLLGFCCRDLHQHAGYLKPSEKNSAPTKDTKKNTITAKADMFLQPKSAEKESAPRLDPDHEAAATALLPVILSSLPQEHLTPTLRAHLDRTAILTRNRDAMLAAVLNPYKDKRGRRYKSILPHLTQQYPHDRALEFLRSNIRTTTIQDDSAMLDSLDEEEEEEEEEAVKEDAQDEEMADTYVEAAKEVTLPVVSHVEVEVSEENPFSLSSNGTSKSNAFQTDTAASAILPKRKHEDSSNAPAKRQELDQPPSPPKEPAAPISQATEANDDSDDDSDESVHLNMELEDDDEGDSE
ncbi:rRNA processing/ribosome biogenesis-domain-containing protein [Stachybotrys elegans]|uniref:Pre-rRNA-processing protein RIX1 n=1 Tax=Stachybotrys elegans TaxID=80388 RepID=A0A8K0T376_9HYPO|nr:rRNA processing/ribosome biogenesis-domain-containing protein [Stachybotrys elegans]